MDLIPQDCKNIIPVKKFGNETDASLIQDLTVYVDIVDQLKDDTTSYGTYDILDGDRPDQVSFKLYGTPNYHWTFYYLNDKTILHLKLKNFLTRSKSNFVDEYEVQTNTVDNVFKDVNLEKTLLKIDVEGFEMNVIKGSKIKLKEIPYILIENQFGNHYKNSNFNDIKDVLLKYNFVESKKFVFPTMHYQDVLFKKI